ncbi:hypothetical protein J6590_085920 [Homalodisca vitripennis]|nr:hypothetical protein J6590_085920 [Homalodisca vitripennis]
MALRPDDAWLATFPRSGRREGRVCAGGDRGVVASLPVPRTSPRILHHGLETGRRLVGDRVGFVLVGKEGWLLPSRYQEQALGYYTMALRPDDAWLATFPRSGGEGGMVNSLPVPRTSSRILHHGLETGRRLVGKRVGFVLVGKEGWLLPSRYQEQALGYYTMALRPDDVWTATFPRSGRREGRLCAGGEGGVVDSLPVPRTSPRIVHHGLETGRRLVGERVGFVQVGREGWLLPSRYQEQALGYYTMALRPDDAWLATFPRSGRKEGRVSAGEEGGVVDSLPVPRTSPRIVHHGLETGRRLVSNFSSFSARPSGKFWRASSAAAKDWSRSACSSPLRDLLKI